MPADDDTFCLWDEWYDIEEELAAVSPTVRVQYDAMRRAVLRGYSYSRTTAAVAAAVVAVGKTESVPVSGERVEVRSLDETGLEGRV